MTASHRNHIIQAVNGPTLHIFNPDTDYALSCRSEIYTPPLKVAAMKRKLALVPALYARCGDAVLAEEVWEEMPLLELARMKGLEVITHHRLPDFISDHKDVLLSPWGWNLSLRRSLRQVFINSGTPLPSRFPDEAQIQALRALAHRRLTIDLNEEISHTLRYNVKIPREIDSVEDGMDFWHMNPGCYFKAPWSSSGRGVMHTADLAEKHVRPWLNGIISSQGSVMAETEYLKTLDFASEWMIERGKSIFAGWSVFEASPRGKYHFNLLGSQELLSETIQSAIDINLRELIEAQRLALDKLVSPFYTGPAGIDMLADAEGTCAPALEINLRTTMGMVARQVSDDMASECLWADSLSNLFPEGKLSLSTIQ